MNAIVTALGEPWLLLVMLLSVRVGTMLLFTPVLYAVSMPATVRVAIFLGLACVLALPFASSGVSIAPEPAALLQAVVREAAVGATLGLGVLMAFAGFAVAGRLVDLQVGFGLAQVFDPLTRTHAPVLSAAFGLFAAVTFFIADGHHALVRGVAYSVDRFPVGQPWALSAAAEPLAAQAAALFTLGFALAAPIVLTLLLVEFALGVVSRNLPQMNMIVMGIPVKIVVGLIALSVWATGFGAPASRLYAQIGKSWTAWFAAGGVR